MFGFMGGFHRHHYRQALARTCPAYPLQVEIPFKKFAVEKQQRRSSMF